jgi:hypothetical protein
MDCPKCKSDKAVSTVGNKSYQTNYRCDDCDYSWSVAKEKTPGQKFGFPQLFAGSRPSVKDNQLLEDLRQKGIKVQASRLIKEVLRRKNT